MNSSPIFALFSLTLIFLNIQLYSQEIKIDERNYELSIEKSSISWVARNETEKFSGTLKIKEGAVTLIGDELQKAIVFANISSINCKECGDSELSQKILKYILSPEFLDAQKMDFAVFKMYQSSVLHNSKDGNFRVEGALTIKGYSNNISLPATILEKKKKIYLDGSFTMNRSLWELSNPKDSEQKNLIGQTIEIYIHLEGELK